MLPVKLGEMAMLSVLTFAVVAVALGMPFVVPLMWGRIEQAYPGLPD
jgi:hypothetical protein